MAYVVCSAAGLASDDYSIAYVAGWAGGDPGHEVRSDVTVFRSVRLRFDLHGVGDEGAATLIEAFTSR